MICWRACARDAVKYSVISKWHEFNCLNTYLNCTNNDVYVWLKQMNKIAGKKSPVCWRYATARYKRMCVCVQLNLRCFTWSSKKEKIFVRYAQKMPKSREQKRAWQSDCFANAWDEIQNCSEFKWTASVRPLFALSLLFHTSHAHTIHSHFKCA